MTTKIKNKRAQIYVSSPSNNENKIGYFVEDNVIDYVEDNILMSMMHHNDITSGMAISFLPKRENMYLYDIIIINEGYFYHSNKLYNFTKPTTFVLSNTETMKNGEYIIYYDFSINKMLYSQKPLGDYKRIGSFEYEDGIVSASPLKDISEGYFQ